MFKFIDGFFACVKLLSDLLCAEIAEYFVEIAILLIVSFAAIVWGRERCVTSPNNGCEGDYTVNDSVANFNCFPCKYGGFIYLTLSRSHNLK